jgi:ribosomal-protein-alanine N-acetyltransferase
MYRAPALLERSRLAEAYNRAMALTLRSYEPRDFAALYRLDQSCFPAGISYSKTTLRYFLTIPSADCVVALEDGKIAGFVVSEENPPLAHIITLDVEERHRRRGVATALLQKIESNLAARGVRSILLETAITNEAAVAFWQRHGYRIEATLKRYYLGRVDAYEMRKVLPAPVRKSGIQPGETN